MKVLLTVSLVVLVVIILALGSYYMIKYYVNIVSANLNALEIATANGDWLKITAIEKKLDENWQIAERFFPVLIDHAELYDLEIFMARKSVLIKQNRKEELLVEISAAKELIKNIYLQQRLTVKNIL